MIYLELFLGFLHVGLFTFGGAYGAIPLIRDVVLSYGWLDDEMITYMIAVSESTPGPIMINLATYVGSSQAGFLGALTATAAVVLPSLIIIILIATAFRSMASNKHFQAVLQGMKPSIIGIILATGAYLTMESCVTRQTSASIPQPAQNNFFLTAQANTKAIIIAMLLIAIMAGWEPLFKKKLSPIGLIAIAAAFGLLFYR